MDKYTYNPDDLHDSILDDNEPVAKPYSRGVATAFLVVGFLFFLSAGVFIGSYVDFVSVSMPQCSSPSGLRDSFLPDKFVLFVDFDALVCL